MRSKSTKQPASEAIANQTAEFLARGGQIKKLESGAPRPISHNEKCEAFRFELSKDLAK